MEYDKQGGYLFPWRYIPFMDLNDPRVLMQQICAAGGRRSAPKTRIFSISVTLFDLVGFIFAGLGWIGTCETLGETRSSLKVGIMLYA